MSTSRLKIMEFRRVTNMTVRQVLQRRTNRDHVVDNDKEAVLPADEVLKPKLQANIVRDDYRSSLDHLHVSDLIYRCTRAMALSDKLNEPIEQRTIYQSNGITFAIGNALEQYNVDRVKFNAPAEIWGNWRCMCGKVKRRKQTLTTVLNKKSCQVCLRKADIYEGFTVKNDDLKITGTMDLVLKLGRSLYINELKSMKRETWETLNNPVPEHVVQSLFYWWLTSFSGRPVHDQLSIVYTVKSQVRGSPYKEFTLKPSTLLYRLDPYIDEARALKEYASSGAVPARTVCDSDDCYAAKQCKFRIPCFALSAA